MKRHQSAIERGVSARLPRPGLLLIFLLVALSALTATRIPAANAAPIGTHFDHIVIIAMENRAYSEVIGSSNAPFINGLAAVGTVLSSDNHYSDNPPCSAACYVEFTTGQVNGANLADGWSCCQALTSINDELTTAGLTWQAYCAAGCPRGLDHFPFPGYSSLQGSPNIFQSSSVSTSTFVAAANSASPPSFLWYTPTDSQNMHDNSVSSGDAYLKAFLTGTGTVSAPAAGSLLASNVFTNAAFHTLLFLWWDECGGGAVSCNANNAVPNVEYGPRAGLKTGYVSHSTYTTFSELAKIGRAHV